MEWLLERRGSQLTVRSFSSGFVGLPGFPQGKHCWLLAVCGGNFQLTWNVVGSSRPGVSN